MCGLERQGKINSSRPKVAKETTSRWPDLELDAEPIKDVIGTSEI